MGTNLLAMISRNQYPKTQIKTLRKHWTGTNGLKRGLSNGKTTNSATRVSNSNLTKGRIKVGATTPTKPKATSSPPTSNPATNLIKLKVNSSSSTRAAIITRGATPLIKQTSSNTGTTIKADTSEIIIT